ncbi:MAG: ATP-binding cassette domain-containing protein [Candidatus Nanopelagicales bacterium]
MTQPDVAPVVTGTAVATNPGRVKVPTILQQAQVECGAASLGMVLAHFGRWESLDTLRAACGVSRDGASAIAIMQAANQFGLEPQGHRGTVDDLNDMATPAIIWVRRSHFVVLEGAHGGTFYVNDPARGRYTVDSQDFAAMYSGAAITFTKSDSFVPAGHRYRATPGLWKRLRKSKSGVNFAIATGLIAMLLGLVLAPVSQLFINGVLESSDRRLLVALMSILLIIGLLRGGMTLLQYGVITRLQAKLTLVGTASFVDRLIHLPLRFYDERSTGDLSQRVGYNSTVASLLATQMGTAGIALIGAIGYAALLIYYSWLIGIVVLLLSFANVVLLRLVMDKRTSTQSRVIRRQNELRGTTTASIQGIETVKSTGMEDDVFTSLTGQQSDYVSATAALVPSSALLVAFPGLLFSLTSASILVLGGWLVMEGSFTLGGLLAVSALAANLNSPIQTLMATGGQLQIVTSSLQALDDVLANEQDSRFDRPALTADELLPAYTGSVVLDRVSFGYSDNGPLVIEDFTLELKPGHRVALVGGSGAGKTTVANLAAGLYQPRTGAVLYDGRPLAQWPLGALERYIAKVDQNIVLFEGTVRENVTLWDSTIPTDQVQQALADAQILDDVLARSGGVDCRVDEAGRNFSGGQCQRIEIARALARNPRVIILDEATSALDDVTEEAVDEALRHRGLSCLIVAHRLSTIRDADEIIVLGHAGAILERGTHDDLMAAAGAYAQMVSDAGDGGDVGT